MLKKVTGGVSLLIFLFTFVIPVLVFTNGAYSHDNREDWYEWTIKIVCLNGEIIDTWEEWRVDRWTDSNHPPDKIDWEWYCWADGYCEWLKIYLHQSHWTTYRLYEDYGTETRSGTPNRCRSLR